MKGIKYVLALLALIVLLVGAFAGYAQDEKVQVVGWKEQTDGLRPGQWFHPFDAYRQSRDLQPAGHLPR